MRVFMATLATETNTFSPIPTGMAGFKEGREWHRTDGSRKPASIANIPLIAWRRLAEADGHTVTESLPYVPLGQIQQPTLHRTAVRDVVPASAPLFWGLQKG